MERKKITFDSFIRAVILGAIIIGVLMLLKRLRDVSFSAERLPVAPFDRVILPCLAYCLSDISVGKLLPA